MFADNQRNLKEQFCAVNSALTRYRINVSHLCKEGVAQWLTIKLRKTERFCAVNRALNRYNDP